VMLNQETIDMIRALQDKYPERRSALIPALHVAQAQVGYLPVEVQQEVAALFEIDTSEVNAVVTFYDMFFEEPVGKHLIHVCKNVSCMLRGSDELLGALCHKLGVKPYEISADGNFTIIPSECLGACDRAPMMLVDDQVVGPVQEGQLEEILQQAKAKRGHPCPILMNEASAHE